MLILSRKIDQEITLGDDISIVIVSVRGNQVRLGIKAPSNVPIRREELAPLDEPRRAVAAAEEAR